MIVMVPLVRCLNAKTLEYDDTYGFVSKYGTPFHPVVEKVMIPYDFPCLRGFGWVGAPCSEPELSSPRLRSANEETGATGDLLSWWSVIWEGSMAMRGTPIAGWLLLGKIPI